MYKLQIVKAEDGAIATFAGRGPVERELVSAIGQAIIAELPAVIAAVLGRGRWWIRPAKFEAALTAALVASVPAAASQAIEAVLWDVKTEATGRFLQGR